MHEHTIRRAEITIETHSVTTISKRTQDRQKFYCSDCGKNIPSLEIPVKSAVSDEDATSAIDIVTHAVSGNGDLADVDFTAEPQ